jgi:hypothetical protein
MVNEILDGIDPQLAVGGLARRPHAGEGVNGGMQVGHGSILSKKIGI